MPLVLRVRKAEWRNLDNMDPHLDCTVHNERGIIGHLVIHNLIQGRAWGGVRLVPDISLEEVRSTARTMAYKYGFIGFPMGGAKAALQIDRHHTSCKTENLVAFGKALSPLIKTGAFIPGIDMNCSVDDLKSIFRGAGLSRDLAGWKNVSHAYTAWSCFIATRVALERCGIDLSDSTFAVQGFGKVASEYATLMARDGAKLLAISNRRGAIANEKGFDIAHLIKTRDETGDDFITHYPTAERVTHERVLGYPVTVLLPAARAWAIHATNCQDIQAPIVVCAANVAMNDDIEHRLFDDGKIVVTDFLANCGGIFGSILEQKVKQEVIWNLLNTAYRKKLSHLLSRSAITGEPLFAIARREAEAQMAGWSERQPSWPDRISRRLWSKAPEGVRTKRLFRFYEELWSTG